jgi:hypothetical protein
VAVVDALVEQGIADVIGTDEKAPPPKSASIREEGSLRPFSMSRCQGLSSL